MFLLFFGLSAWNKDGLIDWLIDSGTDGGERAANDWGEVGEEGSASDWSREFQLAAEDRSRKVQGVARDRSREVQGATASAKRREVQVAAWGEDSASSAASAESFHRAWEWPRAAARSGHSPGSRDSASTAASAEAVRRAWGVQWPRAGARLGHSSGARASASSAASAEAVPQSWGSQWPRAAAARSGHSPGRVIFFPCWIRDPAAFPWISLVVCRSKRISRENRNENKRN